jgi:hypothetical protein
MEKQFGKSVVFSDRLSLRRCASADLALGASLQVRGISYQFARGEALLCDEVKDFCTFFGGSRLPWFFCHEKVN